MKRRFLTLSVLVVCVFSYVFSQDAAPASASKSFRLGLKLSPTLSWIKPNTKDVAKNGYRFGLSYGLMSEFCFSDNYALLTGIDVAYTGGKIEDKRNLISTPAYIETHTYKLQYIEIPLTLKMKTKEYGYITYFANFGLGTSINVKAKDDYKYDSGTTKITETNANVYDKYVNMFRESFIFGLGIEYSLTGSTKAVAGLSFNNGLTDILKGNNKLKGSNNFLGLNAGILF